MFQKKRFLFLFTFILVILIVLFNNLAKALKNLKSENSEKVDLIISSAFDFFESGGDFKKRESEFFKGVTLKGAYDLLEAAYKEALLLEVSSHLFIGKASAEILQNKVDEAIKTYDELLKKSSKNRQAIISKALFLKLREREDEFKSTMEYLKKIDIDLYFLWNSKIEGTLKLIHFPINLNVEKVRDKKNSTIVVLGYALKSDGTLDYTLIERLELAYKLHLLNPTAKIVLSGGLAKEGRTESFLMREYLKELGVNQHLLVQEAASRDTVDNAINSLKIIKNFSPIENLILVTSASHLRRALVLFNEELIREGLNVNLFGLAYNDFKSDKFLYELAERELLVIFKDLMRISGFWSFPRIKK